MIEWIIETANWWVTGFIGLLLYWLPMSLCAVGYTLRAMHDIKNDYTLREGGTKPLKTYHPSIKVGTLIGWAFVSIIPVANLWAAMFDVAPKLFGRFFDWLGDVFDMPLVPDSKRYEEKRISSTEASKNQ